FRQRLRRDFAIHLRQIVEANHFGIDAEWVGEAALRQPTCDRHLATLERGLAAARPMVARARLDAFVSLAGSLSLARTGTMANPAANLLDPNLACFRQP